MIKQSNRTVYKGAIRPSPPPALPIPHSSGDYTHERKEPNGKAPGYRKIQDLPETICCQFCSQVFKPDEYHIEYSKTISGRLIEYRVCPACKSPMIALVEK